MTTQALVAEFTKACDMERPQAALPLEWPLTGGTMCNCGN